MAKYRIEFRKSIEKDLKAIPKKDQIRILRRIAPLAGDPRPATCKRLSGQERYRLRQGNYRILYEVGGDRLIVTIVKIRHRGGVYRQVQPLNQESFASPLALFRGKEMPSRRSFCDPPLPRTRVSPEVCA